MLLYHRARLQTYVPRSLHPRICASQNRRQWRRYIHGGCSLLYRGPSIDARTNTHHWKLPTRARSHTHTRTRIPMYVCTYTWPARAMSDERVTTPLISMKTHHHVENDRYHEGGCTRDSLRRLSGKCILAIWRRRSRVTDISRAENARVVVRAGWTCY